MGDVLQLRPSRIEYENHDAEIYKVTSGEVLTPRITISYENENRNTIDTKSLYPVSQEIRPELLKAFELIKEGLDIIDIAITKFEEKEFISADDYCHRLQVLLPELFCCRSIGDGFGAIIVAVFHSISNMKGEMLNIDQLNEIKKILSRLYTEPFIQYDEAVNVIMNLEDVGFEVEPGYLQHAGELFDV